MTDSSTDPPRQVWRWFVLAVVVVGLFFVNSVRTDSCDRNREDRFRMAEQQYSSLTAAMGELGAAAVRESWTRVTLEPALDREYPTTWYCFGSDR